MKYRNYFTVFIKLSCILWIFIDNRRKQNYDEQYDVCLAFLFHGKQISPYKADGLQLLKFTASAFLHGSDA